ncbi:1-hydroxycarotenoid 3,4-desaturase CrtD [Bosea sp. RAC05]|uniref:1-hydroxycarotenoid 3,4-desaturase CrtD n=1 Tax=Bosea sp. RAC05 TaxID=1842539 RepID=UPI00083E2279|nr:1-hydroxycarotenoid 3,4-desaturase CrtD [Bosea sp. RAC05]AOG07541.1 phytoene desaturase family protein [Bosea sp. RAC05]
MGTPRILVIGAGIGGLVSALLLAARGCDVTLVEKAAAPGGKMREVAVGGRRLDAGPTVMTMRWVFDRIFDEVGEALDRHVTLTPATVLARHAWSETERLDLFADRSASAQAVAAFAGPAEGRNYLTFCDQARGIHDALKDSFMARERPSMLGLVQHMGLGGLRQLWGASPFGTLWDALGHAFQDQRLRQLFGRYATYCGSSPFAAPATLMLVAHVEQEGVWLVEGGMHRLARTLADLATAKGAKLRYGEAVSEILIEGGRAAGVRLASGETLRADAVVSNADVNAIAAGRFGQAASRFTRPTKPAERSLSALTFAAVAQTNGFPLHRHNVFFSRDYAAEFESICRQGRLPEEPTIYVCAQDRDEAGAAPAGPERLLILVNAPPCGDRPAFPPEEIETCLRRSLARMAHCGLEIALQREAMLTTQASDWEALFPATGGGLYGRSTHGAMASFNRPGSRSRLPGLYGTGGSVHPGPGVPMVALSGLLAAQSVVADLASTSRSRPAAMSGGMSTR